MKRARRAFDGDNWLFEIKHHGFRVLATRDGGATRLFTRNGYDISRRHQHIIAEMDRLPDEVAVDSELVVLDDDGRSNFAKLARSRIGTHFYAFDLLMLGDADLRSKPLARRKDILAGQLNGICSAIRYCDHIIGRGKDFFDAVRDMGLEGMVAKRQGSEYAGTAGLSLSLPRRKHPAFPRRSPIAPGIRATAARHESVTVTKSLALKALGEPFDLPAARSLQRGYPNALRRRD